MTERKYFINERKNNEILVQLIDQSVIETVHEIIYGSIFITYIFLIIA